MEKYEKPIIMDEIDNREISMDDWNFREHEYEGFSFCKFTSDIAVALPKNMGLFTADVDSGTVTMNITVDTGVHDDSKTFATKLLNEINEFCKGYTLPKHRATILVPRKPVEKKT